MASSWRYATPRPRYWKAPALRTSSAILRNPANGRVGRRRRKSLGENGLVLGVGAFEIGDFVGTLEVPDAGRDLINQIFIVRDQKHGSGVALQRDIQGVDRFQVEMVGRL